MDSIGYIGHIDYDEPDQSSYTGTTISGRGTDFKKTFTNERRCPVIDHVQLMMFLSEQQTGLIWSSSIDHFYMDGDGYIEQYVTFAGHPDDPDKWEFIDWQTKSELGEINVWDDDWYDFKTMSKAEFSTFQDLRKYIKQWKAEHA